MIRCNVRFVIGLNGPEVETAALNLDAAVVGGVSGPYGVRHLLQLGRHFDHYFDRRRTLPVWQVNGIYSSLPQVGVDVKSHSNDVSGQIGECFGALVMRRIVGLSTSQIEPLLVDANRKTPDFRVTWKNAAAYLPPNLPATVPTPPDEWPLESKARPKDLSSEKGFHEAMFQLATYWLLRGTQRPDIIGFGLICVATDSMANITMHIVIPTQQDNITDLISDFHSQRYTKAKLKEFQAKFRKNSFEVRNYLAHCQPGA
ncbi:hypothetical protein [Rhodopirellula baltica]